MNIQISTEYTDLLYANKRIDDDLVRGIIRREKTLIFTFFDDFHKLFNFKNAQMSFFCEIVSKMRTTEPNKLNLLT